MGDHDLAIVSGILIFLSVLIFFNSYVIPIQARFLSITGITVFVATTVGVSAFCAISTGIPCALALGVTAFLNFAVSTGWLAVVGLVATTSITWIGSMIFTPASLILTVFISRLARGHG